LNAVNDRIRDQEVSIQGSKRWGSLIEGAYTGAALGLIIGVMGLIILIIGLALRGHSPACFLNNILSRSVSKGGCKLKVLDTVAMEIMFLIIGSVLGVVGAACKNKYRLSSWAASSEELSKA